MGTRSVTVEGRSLAVANGLSALYVVMAVVGLFDTWYFNLGFAGDQGQSYLQAWFANDASSSGGVDLIVVAITASVFMVREGHRLGMRGRWLYVTLTPTVAVAFTLPLFLAVRERALLRAADRATADAEVAR